MNRILVATLFSASMLTSACGDEAGAPDDDTGIAEVGPTTGERLHAWLIGDYDSAAQADEDRSYYAISLRMCPVDFPSLGERVLYVEQASMDSLDDPYRQRFYVVEDLDDGSAISHVYEPVRVGEVSTLVGLCDDPTRLDVSGMTVEERAGCGVVMSWDGERLVGGTEGTGCSSSLGGADYATAVVTISADEMTSWDQGWNADGEQVWGATDGAYIFDRRSALVSPE